MNYIKKEQDSHILQGFREFDFVTKEGQRLTGVSVFLSSPITKNGEGQSFVKASISTDTWDRIKKSVSVGDTVSCLYNRYGKIRNLIPVDVDDDVDFGD